MLFNDIPGHEVLKRRLIENVKNGIMPHARLFLGADGAASMPLALAYAQYIHCESKRPDDSCGVCSACLKNNKYIHPDLHFSFPFAGKKDDHSNLFIKEWRRLLLNSPFITLESWMAELSLANKQLNINIKECHQVHSRLSMKPFEAEFQILIMWLPEFLGKEGNSLLKLVEEPTPTTLLIFVGENKDAILPTILSRTQLILVPAYTDQEVSTYLEKITGTCKSEAQSLAFLSEGSLGLALQLKNLKNEDFSPLFNEWMKACTEGNPAVIVGWVEQFSRSGKTGPGRETQKSFLHYALKMIREALLTSLGAMELLRTEEGSKNSPWFGSVSARNAPQIIAELDRSVYHIERNANPKILFLDVSLRLHVLLNMH